ncbi:MAG TPA: hypothetical protein VK988_19865 [Acidimicrobiales bacterium]|nr:hypothetical protein [Acidimicrobiales bacterium]
MDGRIDLVEAELRALSRSVIDRDAGQPFGVYAGSAAEPIAAVGREVERIVFGQAFDNSPALLAAEYGRYDEASLFFCVLDHRRGLPAGMMRVIRPSPAGLKSVHDLERLWGHRAGEALPGTGAPLALDRLWDLATLAVMPEYRGRGTSGLVSLALYQAVCTSARQCGIEQFVAIIDMAVFRLLQWQLGRPFSRFSGVQPMGYLGSLASLPVWCDIAEWSRRVAEVDAATCELVVEGRGLEPSVKSVDFGAVVSIAGQRPPLESSL